MLCHDCVSNYIHLCIMPTEGLVSARACMSCPAICGSRLATKEHRKNTALACLITPLHAFLCDANQREKSMSMGAALVEPTLSFGTMPAATKSRCWVFEQNSKLFNMKHVLIAPAKLREVPALLFTAARWSRTCKHAVQMRRSHGEQSVRFTFSRLSAVKVSSWWWQRWCFQPPVFMLIWGRHNLACGQRAEEDLEKTACTIRCKECTCCRSGQIY